MCEQFDGAPDEFEWIYACPASREGKKKKEKEFYSRPCDENCGSGLGNGLCTLGDHNTLQTGGNKYDPQTCERDHCRKNADVKCRYKPDIGY